MQTRNNSPTCMLCSCIFSFSAYLPQLAVDVCIIFDTLIFPWKIALLFCLYTSDFSQFLIAAQCITIICDWAHNEQQ
jgi:hypothetical protein